MGNSSSPVYKSINTDNHTDVDSIIEKIINKSTSDKLDINELINNIKDEPQLYTTFSKKYRANLATVIFIYYVGDIEIIKLMLANGANINHLNNENWNALRTLCRYYGNNTEAIKLLLDNGADVNQLSNNNWSALMILCRHHGNNTEAIKLLLDNGASVHHKVGDMNPLMLLSKHFPDNNEMIKEISGRM